MIISNSHRFVFIHIPKCAGSSVREVLAIYDQKKIPSGFKNHPDFGALDYNHIPLPILRTYFRKEYENVRDYYSFAIMRDPFKRFPSALRQRLGFHLKQMIQTLPRKELIAEVENTIKILEKHAQAKILPAELIHFQEQRSYIYDGNSRMVDAVYEINNVAKMFFDLETKFDLKFGKDCKNKKSNQSPMVYKKDLFRKIDQSTKYCRDMFLSLVPLKIKHYLKKNLLTRPQDLDIFNSNYVKSFITDFYKEDIRLYNELFGN